MRSGPVNVTHVISDLDIGGAEMVLRNLILAGDGERFRIRVVSLKDLGPIGAELRSKGVDVRAVGLDRPSTTPRLRRLIRWLHRPTPHVVQTWLVHGDLLGGLAARAAGADGVAWGVHHVDLGPTPRRLTAALDRLNVPLSRIVPDRIVFAGPTTAAPYIARGYPSRKVVTIPYGLPAADQPRRDDARRRLGLPLGVPLIARIGRFHPQKDHRTLLEAFALVRRRVPSAQLVCCGRDIDSSNPLLQRWLRQTGVADGVHLLGERRDVDLVHAAADVEVSSSAFGESFPMVLLEAMAAGTPVVATDVGDSRLLCGEGALLVPPADAASLAQAVVRTLEDPSGSGHAAASARQRVQEQYTIQRMVDAYATLHESLADGAARRVHQRPRSQAGGQPPPGA